MTQYQQLAIDKFTDGMIDENQLSRLSYPSGACVECEDVVFMPTGAIRKRKGYSKLNTTVWASGNYLTKVSSFNTTAGTNYALAFSITGSPTCAAGSACIASVQTTGYGSDVAAFTTISITGASAASAWAPVIGEPITVANYAASAVMTYWGQASVPLVWPAIAAGTNLIEVTAMPSGAKVVCAWGNYLFLGNILDDAGTLRLGSRIRWNTSSDIDGWPTAQYIDIDADDGDEITAMCIYKNNLVVFKKYKMFVVHYVGGVLIFEEERISAGIGCVGPNALIDYGGTLYFIGAYTAYKWEGSGEPRPISDKIQGQWDQMNIEHSCISDVDSDDATWQIWFNLATGSSTTKNVVYAFDPRFDSWTRYSLSATCLGGIDYGTTEAYLHKVLAYSSYSERIRDALSNKEGVLCLGGAGYLYKYGDDDSDDGNPIIGYWISRWLDFGLPHSNKRLLRATAYVERLIADGDYNLHVDLYTDWNTATVAASGSQTVSLSGDVSYPMLEKRIDFTKQLRAAQFKIYTDGADEPFTLHRLLIDWVPKGKTKVS